MNNVCPIPTPPVTTKAPEVDEVEAVDDEIEMIPPIVSTLNFAVSDPSATTNADVSETVIRNLLVAAIVPVEADKEPLRIFNPEIDEVLEEEV